MASQPSLVINLNESWPASRIATAILEAFRKHYNGLDIDGVQSAMDEIWRDLIGFLSADERSQLAEISHIAIPTAELSASITRPPSRIGNFVIFDAVLDLKLREIFMAPRNVAAWSASYLRAAFGSNFSVAKWVEAQHAVLTSPDLDHMPDSYSVQAALRFIYAHEWGHFFLNHLGDGRYRERKLGGNSLFVFDPAQQQEVDADQFARDLLRRKHADGLGDILRMQQMGADWLFASLSSVIWMRQVAAAIQAGTDAPLSPPATIAQRREISWNYYERACAESEREADRSPDSAQTVERVRISVNNFVADMPRALAHIWAREPKAVLDWADHVSKTQVAESDGKDDYAELMKIATSIKGPDPTPSLKTRIQKWFRI